jgi:hypothetical protein
LSVFVCKKKEPTQPLRSDRLFATQEGDY